MHGHFMYTMEDFRMSFGNVFPFYLYRPKIITMRVVVVAGANSSVMNCTRNNGASMEKQIQVYPITSS